MKFFLLTLTFFFTHLLVHAQQDRFLYLQTENRQPFFVIIENGIFNSSPLDYLIIPKLDEKLYSLVIGFPDSNYELEFNCSIKNKDIGYIIKNTGDRQWKLLNLQTQNFIIAADIKIKKEIAYEKATDAFSIMLANAVRDSSILLTDVTKSIIAKNLNEQNHQDTLKTFTTNNDATLSKVDNSLGKDSTSKEVAGRIPEIPDGVHKKDTAPQIISITEVPTATSDKQLKIDSINRNDAAKELPAQKPVVQNQKDTMQIVSNEATIGNSVKNNKSRKRNKLLQDSAGIRKGVAKAAKPERISENKDTIQNVNADNAAVLRSIIKRKIKSNNKEGIEMVYIDNDGNTKDTIKLFIVNDKKKKNDAEIKVPEQIITASGEKKPDTLSLKVIDRKKALYKITKEEREIINEANSESVIRSAMINSDCKTFAADEDFLKVRKKMVAENNDEEMIKVAKKTFRSKCFTTQQIKNLSVLFLKDEGKYMFFDAAYPFVSDSDLYYTLENELSDNYYITRFRAMIHK